MKVLRILFLAGSILLCIRCIPVLAHAALVRAEPAPNSILDRPPIEIRAWFSSPLSAGSKLKVFDTQFRNAPVGSTVIDTSDPTMMRAPIEPLQPGRYTVNWEATADDGHVALGSYEFVVREGADALTWPLVGGIVLLTIIGTALYLMRRSAGRQPASP